MPGRLSPQQIQAFEEDGYVIFDEPVLPAARFDALKAHFERKLADWQHAGRAPEQMDTPHFQDPVLFDWLFADEVLDVVESVIGPDIALWSSHFICKPAQVGKRVPWHEDSAYWGKVVEPMQVVTVLLALDAASPDNGCMRVIPGTHHGGYSKYQPVADGDASVFDNELAPDQFDDADAVDIVLEPNQCSLHHAKLIHGSNANTGGRRRCAYTMRYFPTTCRYHPELRKDKKNFQVYLARGTDRAGNRYGDPTVAVEV